VIVPGISLINTWEEITLYGQDGQQIDKVSYSSVSSDSSLYFSENNWDVRLFEHADSSSLWYVSTPWISICPVEHVPNCNIFLQWSKSLHANKKVNMAIELDNRLLSNTNKSYHCSWYWDYLPDDFDTGNCNPSSILFTSWGLYDLEVDIFRDGDYFCWSEYRLNLPETKQSEEILCVNDSIVENIETPQNISYDIPMTDIDTIAESLLAQPYIDIRNDMIVLNRILPNPSWKDADQEWLVISNLTDFPINLEDISLDNGKKKTPLQWNILPGEELALYQTLWLYNYASCVRLWFGTDTLLGEICYPKAKDDVWYHPSQLTVSSLSDVDRFWKLLLKELNEEICVMYNNEPILCKTQIVTKDELSVLKKEISTSKKELKAVTKEESKATRLSVSLQKKLDLSEEKLSKEKAKTKINTEKYALSISELKQDKRDLQLLASLHKEFIYESVDRLRGPRKPIYEETEISMLYTQRRDIQKEFESWNKEFSYGSVVLPREDLILAYKIRTETVDLTDMPIVDLYGPALIDFKDRIETLKDLLYTTSSDDTLTFADDFPWYINNK